MKRKSTKIPRVDWRALDDGRGFAELINELRPAGGPQRTSGRFTRRHAIRVAASFALVDISSWDYVKRAFGFDMATLEAECLLSTDERLVLQNCLFGCPISPCQVVAGADHAKSVNGVHPDNAKTAAGILIRLLGLSPQSARKVDDIAVDAVGTKVGIGSPGSYGEYGRIFNQDNPLHLPILYGKVDDQRDVVRRYLGGSSHTAPRRGLLVDDTFHPVLSYPNGWQQTDDCLVTVLPDLDNLSQSGGRLVLIGGAHGVATRAFVEMFRDHVFGDWFLRNLERVVSKTPFFQARLHLERIRHSAGHSMGKMTVERSEFRPLDHDATLRRAERFVSSIGTTRR